MGWVWMVRFTSESGIFVFSLAGGEGKERPFVCTGLLDVV